MVSRTPWTPSAMEQANNKLFRLWVVSCVQYKRDRCGTDALTPA